MITDILFQLNFFADITIITTFTVKYKGVLIMKFYPDYQLQILTEERFAEEIPQVLARLAPCRQEGYFRGFDGQKLYYEYFLAQNSRGAVVVLHGLSEFTQKYHEFAYYLLNQGYDVFLYDQRCHGKSCRLTDRTDMIHVDCFTDYHKDLHCFVNAVVRVATDKPLYLYAHSMGGAVAAQYLAEHPEVFQKAVLSAPMIEPLTGSVSPVFARAGLSMYLLFKDGKQKFWFSAEFDPEYKFERSCDKSRARFERNMQIRLAEPRYCTTPFTLRWVQQSLMLRPKMNRRSFLRKIHTPILMLCADRDGVVNECAQAQFAKKCDTCHRIVISDSTHAMLNGSDDNIREHVQAVLDHFC